MVEEQEQEQRQLSEATDWLISALLIGLPLAIYVHRSHTSADKAQVPKLSESEAESESETESERKSVMSPENPSLAPPKDDPITPEELSQYDGRGDKIYVAIKGTIFDVSAKSEMYGQGKSYNIFAGKDGSRGLGMSSLKPEDAVADYSTLDEKDRSTLDNWYSFFEKRYNIVGRVVESTNSSSNL